MAPAPFWAQHLSKDKTPPKGGAKGNWRPSELILEVQHPESGLFGGKPLRGWGTGGYDFFLPMHFDNSLPEM